MMDSSRYSLPRYPKIPDRYNIVKVQDGEYRLVSLIESYPLREQNATDMLSRLFPMLNGQHKISEILNTLADIDMDALLEVITALTARGLLEDASNLQGYLDHSEAERYREQLTYFSHFTVENYDVAERGAPKSKFEFQHDLKQAKVVLLGLGRAGSNLVRLLLKMGVGQILGIDSEKVSERDIVADAWFSQNDLGCFRTDALASKVHETNPYCTFQSLCRDTSSQQEISELIKGHNLVIVCQDYFDPALYEACNLACLAQGVTWTSFRLFGFEINIGPTIIPFETPCYKCFDLRRKGNLTFYEEYTLLEQHLKDNRLESGYLYLCPGVDLVALEALKILTGLVDPATYGKLLCINLFTLETRLHTILKLPRCPHCAQSVNGRPTISAWDA